MEANDVYEIELSWQLMFPMEQSIWATTLALHVHDSDGGLGAADAAVLRLRSLGLSRSRRQEPEHEAAAANVHMELEEFVHWFPVAYRMKHWKERGYKDPSQEQIKTAFEIYSRCLTDYY